jgi:hypothetical protein
VWPVGDGFQNGNAVGRVAYGYRMPGDLGDVAELARTRREESRGDRLGKPIDLEDGGIHGDAMRLRYFVPFDWPLMNAH